ncbi:MAG: chloride channel protein, partial [Alphaproteobacteria bacterium]|nr:chloride channel protein [Alphaproteobacteria bacterium]
MTLPNFGQILRALDRITRHEQVVLSMLAAVIGGIGGGAAIAFREGLGAVQYLFYGFSSEQVVTHIEGVAWWHILGATTVGGLTVGLIVEFLMPGKRPLGVPDVMEASALKGGRMSLTDGIRAA